MNKEQLKNQIIDLLKDIFSFSFGYKEESNIFIADFYDSDCSSNESAYIRVNKEGIDFNVGGREGYDEGYNFSRYMYIDKLAKLTKYLKEFYK